MRENHTGHLWIEEGEARKGLVAEVAPILPLLRTYTFSVPAELQPKVSVGLRVLVPIGRSGRIVRGFIIELDQRIWDSTRRPIDSLLDEESYLTPHLVDLGREISTHYHCPLGQTLKAMTPEAVRRGSGLIRVRYAQLRDVSAHDETRTSTRSSKKRRAIIVALSSSNDPVRVDELLVGTAASASVLRRLVKEQVVELSEREESPTTQEEAWRRAEPDFELNPEQKAALTNVEAAIQQGQFCVRLLYGVSGSGKTEVYVHAMRRALAFGKQAILLVPEIVLTTQLVARLAERFDRVAVLHSEMTDVQRAVMWREIAAGTRNVIIGTRSAVFAPASHLGLICVDEEQEGSYKNLQAPRFHVRDVAIMRAKLLGIPVVLGSATPSLETWHRSGSHKDYQRIELPRRVRDLPMPEVHLVDMRDEFVEQKRPVVISRVMERMLRETINRSEQAIVLMNRRGFANRLFCPQCKTRVTCPRCNVGLVVHSATGHSICHYCHQKIATPVVCANMACGATLMHVGFGTQRVEQILMELFPSARMRRVDSDTMRHRSHYQSLIDDFASRRIDLLVGTQMIAKGLDFPNVSFVGVVSAEPAGLSSDFRAQERLFQLITQVAGRAGRFDKPGRVIVQTISPELSSLQFALRHNYEGFASGELQSREHVGWPPFRRLARIVVRHARPETARRKAQMLSEHITAAMLHLGLQNADVLGPDPCAISRLRSEYRFEIIIRAASAADLRRLFDHLESRRELAVKGAGFTLDVDPVEFT